MMGLDDIIEDATKLPSRERSDLAARLIESLESDVDDGADAAWGEEIARRLHEVDAGLVKPIPWSEAREKILLRSR